MLLITTSFKIYSKVWPIAQVRSRIVFSPDLVFPSFWSASSSAQGKNSLGHEHQCGLEEENSWKCSLCKGTTMPTHPPQANIYTLSGWSLLSRDGFPPCTAQGTWSPYREAGEFRVQASTCPREVTVTVSAAVCEDHTAAGVFLC